MSHRTQKVEQM
jgi:hypothetical protein